MRLQLLQAWTLLAVTLASARRPARCDHEGFDYYVVDHEPTEATIQELAAELQLEVVEPLGELQDHWLLSRRRSDNELVLRTGASGGDPVLETLHRLRARANKPPQLGSFHQRSAHEQDIEHARRLAASVRLIEHQVLRQRIKRVLPPPTAIQRRQNTDDPVDVIRQQFNISDPRFDDQWHIVGYPSFRENTMNVTSVWAEGITGRGVTVALVDDGLDYESVDLADNFDAEGSHDFNTGNALPKPLLEDDTHGTRCAGEIAAARNDNCGVGLAYDARVAGLRMLSGPVTDADEAAALNYGFQRSSIWSNSWGPEDDGSTMEAPSYLSQKAMLNGVQNGREGRGSVYVFASGNGAAKGDQCNFDGYANSIFSIAVGAMDVTGERAYYSEACAAVMVVTYSSSLSLGITTTDVGTRGCTSIHGGTSAATPLASAVFALALQARPELTWRDIQHLCVNTAVQVNPDEATWELTFTGRPFGYRYGFGRLDASRYVAAAKSWTLVKPHAVLELPAVGPNGQTGVRIPSGGLNHTIQVTEKLLNDNNFETLEHVTVQVWIDHDRRGDVEVELTSPHGIVSILAAPRELDDSRAGFVGWQFSTLKHWDEPPAGNWTLRVSDQDRPSARGTFIGWSMTLWGAVIDPDKYQPYALPVPGSAGGSNKPTIGQPMPTPGTQGTPGDSALRRTLGPVFYGFLAIVLYFAAF